jgi:hypothetical protein
MIHEANLLLACGCREAIERLYRIKSRQTQTLAFRMLPQFHCNGLKRKPLVTFARSNVGIKRLQPRKRGSSDTYGLKAV